MYYIILGLIQGLTEFLPVSSSGHLVISQYLFGIDLPGFSFEIFVHLGTSLAVIFMYKKEIKELLTAFLFSCKFVFNKDKFAIHMRKDTQCKFAWLLLISTIPAAVFGYFLNTTFEKIFANIALTASMLIITGFALFFTDRFTLKFNGNKKIKETGFFDALFIGFAQALAIIPGISRSGFTIMMAVNRKLDREFAAKYSFILSVPIIIGASLYKIKEISHLDINIGILFISGFTAFLSGYWAMTFFIKMLVNFKLRFFSYYLWIIGSVVLFLNI